MSSLADFREQYPQYNDMSDSQLANALYNKFYSDMPRAQFDARLGIQPQSQPSATPQPTSAPSAQAASGTPNAQNKWLSSLLATAGNEIYNTAADGAQRIADVFNPNSAQNVARMEAEKKAPFLDISNEVGDVRDVGRAALDAVGLVPSSLLSPARSAFGSAYDAVSPSFTTQQKQQLAASGVTLPSGQQVFDTAMAALRPGSAGPAGLITKPLEVAPADVKAAATNVYNDPAVRSTAVQPFQIGKVISDATNAPEFAQFNAQDEPGIFRVIDEMRQTATGRLPSGQIAPRPTINQLDTWSKRLGKFAKETQMTPAGPQPTPQAGAAMQIKVPIDDLVASVAPGWQDADANYSAFKTAQTFDKKSMQAQNKADGGTGDYYGRMRTAATQLLANPRGTVGWSPENIQRLRTIQKGTATQNTLSWFGNLLSSKLKHGVGSLIGGGIGLAHGGAEGGAIGAGLGAMADAGLGKSVLALRNAIAARRAKVLSQSLLAQSPYARSLPPVPASSPDPLLSIIPAQTLAAAVRARMALGVPGYVPAYAGNQQQ